MNISICTCLYICVCKCKHLIACLDDCVYLKINKKKKYLKAVFHQETIYYGQSPKLDEKAYINAYTIKLCTLVNDGAYFEEYVFHTYNFGMPKYF